MFVYETPIPGLRRSCHYVHLMIVSSSSLGNDEQLIPPKYRRVHVLACLTTDCQMWREITPQDAVKTVLKSGDLRSSFPLVKLRSAASVFISILEKKYESATVKIGKKYLRRNRAVYCAVKSNKHLLYRFFQFCDAVKLDVHT